jgi:hypothetical protein
MRSSLAILLVFTLAVLPDPHPEERVARLEG